MCGFLHACCSNPLTFCGFLLLVGLWVFLCFLLCPSSSFSTTDPSLSVITEQPGSSTILVATLDKKLNQLSYSNIGDCGLMVVRHIDSETAGYMRERARPRHLRTTDLRIAYLSQQQLRSFNLPYQLGFSNIQEIANTNFESPTDADTASIPVMPGKPLCVLLSVHCPVAFHSVLIWPEQETKALFSFPLCVNPSAPAITPPPLLTLFIAGDVIIMATDGLFDNVDLDEIVNLISEWENTHFAEEALTARSANGNQAVQALAEKLVHHAREVSLDSNRDSPFAILAKENDIMWGGGMPDDTTVIVVRIVAG